MSVMDKVAEYDLLRGKAKTIKSRMDELAKEIKKHLTDTVTPDSKGSYYSESDDYVFGNMAKKTVKLNEERAKVFFKENNLLEEVSEVKVTINEDKVAQLLADGKITQDDLEKLVDIKTNYSIDIKPKQKEDEEIVEVKVASSPKPKRRIPTRR